MPGRRQDKVMTVSSHAGLTQPTMLTCVYFSPPLTIRYAEYAETYTLGLITQMREQTEVPGAVFPVRPAEATSATSMPIDLYFGRASLSSAILACSFAPHGLGASLATTARTCRASGKPMSSKISIARSWRIAAWSRFATKCSKRCLVSSGTLPSRVLHTTLPAASPSLSNAWAAYATDGEAVAVQFSDQCGNVGRRPLWFHQAMVSDESLPGGQKATP